MKQNGLSCLFAVFLLFTICSESSLTATAGPLHDAAKKGDLKRIETLIETGTNINAIDENDLTALHYAALEGNRSIAQLLVDKGADINAQNREGWTPLHYAVLHGKKEIVELLVACGVDMNIKDKNGKMPLYVAMEERNEDIAVLLINADANINIFNTRRERGKTLLHQAAQTGYCEVAKSLLDRGIDVNIKSDNGMTPLHFAVTNYTFREDHLNMVMLLVARGAAIDDKDQMGRTPLNVVTDTVVMSSGKEPLEYRIAKFLISKGADINTKHEYGRTALHWAAGTAQKDLVELLIAKGAEIDSRDWNGNTPLHWAVKRHVYAEEELSRNDNDIIVKGISGHTALIEELRPKLDGIRQTSRQFDLTISNTSKNVTKLLITKGANVNAKNNDGDTPLIEAAKGADKELLELLVASGADVNAKGKDGLTAVDNAAQQGRKNIVKFLLAKDADIGPSDKAKTTPLHLAAEHGKKDMVEFWIAKGADINAKNEHGVTPLGLAVGGHKDIAKLPQAKDSRGYFKRADYFSWQNEFDRAIEDYTSACRLDPENDDAYFRRGRAWAKKGNSEQAVADWKRAIELNWGNFVDVYCTRRLLKSRDAQLDRLIKEVAERHLDDLDMVSGYAVGYGETPGYFYTLSLIISKPFEEDKFLKMVRNDNPVIRAMALICLARHDVSRYEGIIRSFYTDRAEVKYLPFGDIVTSITLDKLAEKILKNRYFVNLWSAHHTDSITDIYDASPEFRDEAGEKNGVIELLIADRADVNMKDQDGETPLHYAAQHGDKHAAKLLIANRADVNTKNNNGETPLHCATRWGYKDVIELLIANGADIELKTKAGSTALQIAIEMDYQGLSSLLRKHAVKD